MMRSPRSVLRPLRWIYGRPALPHNKILIKKVLNMDTKLIRWPRLLVAAITMLFAGVIYAWSVLKAPLGAEFGWTPSQLALNFTLTLCFFCIGGVVGSKLTPKAGPKITLWIAAALVAAGFFLASRLSGNVIMLYVAYAGLAGLGIGITYNVVISCTNAWYPDKKGTCSGVMMMCFGFSSLLLGKVADAMFAMDEMGWRKTYMIFGIAIAAVIAVCALGIQRPAPGTVFPEAASKGNAAKEDFAVENLITAEMAKRSSFWRFFIFSVLTSAVGSSVISFARDLALSVGAEAALATTLVGVLSLCNGLGRIICGFVFDAFGRRKTMMISNMITIIAPLVVLLAVTEHSLGLCIVGLCLTGICYGFSPTISSSFVGAFYGLKYFPTNYSLANMMLIPSSFASTLASALLTSTGGYAAPFIMLLTFAIVALVLNISIKRP